MRKSFSSIQQCTHVWAQNTQAEGYAGNVSFNNGVIYSYRYWPMAAFVTNDRGEEAVLIRDETYSNSTSRHQSYVWRSLPSYVRKIVLYGDLSNTEREWRPNATMRRMVLQKVADSLGKAKRARKYTQSHLNRAQQYVEAFNELCEFYRAEYPDVARIPWGGELDEQIASIEAQAEAQRVRDEAEREERRKALAAERIEQLVKARFALHEWKQGAVVRDPWLLSDLPCALRLVDEGRTIQTSHGAEVPASYARRLWALIGNCRHNNTTYHPENFEVGAFRLRAVEADGTLQIGCHTIPYAATRELAVALGFMSEEDCTAEVDREVENIIHEEQLKTLKGEYA